VTVEYTEDMRTYTTLFTYSKPSVVLDKLLVFIQRTKKSLNGEEETIDVGLNDWVIEYPKKNP
jgi:hypothetical protein